jgi:hypothetical protein
MVKQNTKKFKDTAVGKFFMKKLPDLAAGALSGGPLGALGALIEQEPNITPEEKEQLHRELVEMYQLEVEDRDSARKREVEIAKTGRIDWMFNLTGVVGLGAFAVIIWAIIGLEIPEGNKELFYHMIGIIEGVALSIFGYYFGTSMKDNDKK